MAIKELAFSAKQHLNSATGQQFKQSHVYELLAACNGFKSSASLNSHHVFATLDDEPDISSERLLLLHQQSGRRPVVRCLSVRLPDCTARLF